MCLYSINSICTNYLLAYLHQVHLTILIVFYQHNLVFLTWHTCTLMSSETRIQSDCTRYLISCAKSLISYGPKSARLSFKYHSCPKCSNTFVTVLLSSGDAKQRKFSGHLNIILFHELQTNLNYYLAKILDQYMFIGRSH